MPWIFSIKACNVYGFWMKPGPIADLNVNYHTKRLQNDQPFKPLKRIQLKPPWQMPIPGWAKPKMKAILTNMLIHPGHCVLTR
jgi:hypothetical protein